MPKASPQVKVRLPADVKHWLIEEAAKNSNSQNSEVVRSIRERVDRQARNRRPRTAAA